MSPPDRTELARAALSFVNSVRGEAGLAPVKKLVPGVPRDMSRCAVALTLEAEPLLGERLDGHAGPMGVELRRWNEKSAPGLYLTRGKPTRHVTDFMYDFDEGKYPELIASPTPTNPREGEK